MSNKFGWNREDNWRSRCDNDNDRRRRCHRRHEDDDNDRRRRCHGDK